MGNPVNDEDRTFVTRRAGCQIAPALNSKADADAAARKSTKLIVHSISLGNDGVLIGVDALRFNATAPIHGPRTARQIAKGSPGGTTPSYACSGAKATFQ
jgi:hypothetical protein